MATVEELLRQAEQAQGEINSLRTRLSHAQSYTERQTINARIRRLTNRLNALYSSYMKAMQAVPVTVFKTRKKPKTTAGLSVGMDISTDGRYFSNPAPKITNGHRVWVRAMIDMAQKSPFSTAQTEIPEMIRCTWVIPRGWTVLDRYSRYGRVEPVVSIPLILTREFKAPTSGTTRANFGMYADPYYPINPTFAPPETAQVEVETVAAVVAPGTYLIYTLTSNVLSSAASVTFAAETTFIVDEADDRLFYTDGNTYLLVRLIETGAYAGKYIVIGQNGITLDEVTGSVE